MPALGQPLLPRFPDPRQRGWAYYQTPEEVLGEPALLGYAHHLLRAFDPRILGITGALCIDGRPTIYFRRSEQPLSWTEANNLQRVFWNQGIATVLILADPDQLRIYSGQASPTRKGDDSDRPKALIDTLIEDVADLLELDDLLHEVASGKFYHRHADGFDEKQAVDEFLLKNLAKTRNLLTSGPHALNDEDAHSLLGRLIFLCYLTDRAVIDWKNYEREVGRDVTDIHTLLQRYPASAGLDRLQRLFKRLHTVFNGSMFDDDLETKFSTLEPHYETLRLFFSATEVDTGQVTFWMYDFSVIPVEVISAIYEEFLGKQDADGKHKQGAYYTPRHLVEMIVDTAISNDSTWTQARYLDPSCGSGIFLVTLFNRLASLWVFENREVDYKGRAKALLDILHTQLRGVDIDPTACRIACFSLYLAFLDQFDPRDLREFAERAERRGRQVLPRLMHLAGVEWRESHDPTVVEKDFHKFDAGGFQYVIGNPPWMDRGTQQEAWKFMQKAPRHLGPGGCGCLILPAKVLFNKTDDLQTRWFQIVSVDRVINLSDFRHVLFEHAISPAVIMRFVNMVPSVDHRFVYETPKVSGSDFRDGVITVFPEDRKRLKQDELLTATHNKQAPKFWKQHFTGTPRDARLLSLLEETPKLGDIAKHPREDKDKKARWYKGQGIKPKGPDLLQTPWWDDQRWFLSARKKETRLFVFTEDCERVGDRFHPKVHRKSSEELFEPPAVLASQGFGKVAFCDFPILFQHSLQAITVASPDPKKRAADSDLLLFLAVYLRSRLANYYLFHTSANWGVERDKIHLFELMHLPFPLPGTPFAHADAKQIVRETAVKAKALRSELQKGLTSLHQEKAKQNFALDSKEFKRMQRAFNEARRSKVDALQQDLEAQIYRYFDLTAEEVALIDDTLNLVEPSSTPTSREKVRRAEVESLKTVKDYMLRDYADMLTSALNAMAKGGKLRVGATAARTTERPFVFLTLYQDENPQPFRFTKFNQRAEKAFARTYDAGIDQSWRFAYPRSVTWFDGPRIHLLKPGTRLHWTRTAALNDADTLFAEVIRQRRSKLAQA